MLSNCDEILSDCTPESYGALKLVTGRYGERYGLEVWQGGRIIELFIADEQDVRTRAAAWFGDGGCDPGEMTPHDLLLFTTSQKQWWSENCDPARGRSDI